MLELTQRPTRTDALTRVTRAPVAIHQGLEFPTEEHGHGRARHDAAQQQDVHALTHVYSCIEQHLVQLLVVPGDVGLALALAMLRIANQCPRTMRRAQLA